MHMQVNEAEQSYNQTSYQASCSTDKYSSCVMAQEAASWLKNFCANTSILDWPQKYYLLTVSTIHNRIPKTYF